MNKQTEEKELDKKSWYCIILFITILGFIAWLTTS